jgi:hypothetical protein
MILAEIRAFGRALAVQKRVIGALFMREFVTRWGRRNLGFTWLFAEPLVFAFPVIFMWSRIRAPFEHGLPMIAFVWSGYLPLLVFRHVTGHALYTVKMNAAMLYHRQVTPLDIFIGRQGLEHRGQQYVVGIEKSEILGLRTGECGTGVAGGGRAAVALVQDLYPVAVRAQDTRRCIGRAVVDDNHLGRLALLSKCAVDGPSHGGDAIAHRDDDCRTAHRQETII